MTWGQSGSLDLDCLGLAPYYTLPVLTGAQCLDHLSERTANEPLIIGERQLYRVIKEYVGFLTRRGHTRASSKGSRRCWAQE
jgi:hypothetical protein